jgi:hypothetical protein
VPSSRGTYLYCSMTTTKVSTSQAWTELLALDCAYSNTLDASISIDTHLSTESPQLAIFFPTARDGDSNAMTQEFRARRPRLSFRSFYISVLIVSVLAVASLVADQAARYRYGTQYGVVQRQQIAALDPSRLFKRDEEVSCEPLHGQLPPLQILTWIAVRTRSLCGRQMCLYQSQLSR